MTESNPSSTAAPVADNLPEVCLEVGNNKSRSTMYSVADSGFLIGTVPGCDLRVPGSDWPAVSCLISRHPSGASFRRLSPTQPVLINGEAQTAGNLTDGDRIQVGPVEMSVQIRPASPAAIKIIQGNIATPPAPAIDGAREKLQQQIRQFREEVVQFDDRQARAEAETALKQKELAQREAELERQRQSLEAEKADLATRPPAVAAVPDEKFQELDRQLQQCATQKQELAAQRQELAEIRTQLYERYRERRDRLSCMQESVNKAARKVQERKQQLESEVRGWEDRRREDAERKAALEAQAADVEQARALFAEERRVHDARMAELEIECQQRLEECRQRDEALAADRAVLERDQARLKEDLLRQDRQRADLAQRAKEIEERSRDLEERLTQLRGDTLEMETQVVQLDEWHAKLTAVGEKMAKQKSEQEHASQQLAQRVAAVEGQQAALAALRTRLERLREEVRQQEQQLSQQRTLQEVAEAELTRKQEESRELREDIDAEKTALEQERRMLADRAAVMDAAVSQLRASQERQTADEQRIRDLVQAHDTSAAQQTEASSLLHARIAQYEELHKRLEAERESLRERGILLAQAEQARETLQEQLRRRSDELAQRQKALSEHAAQHEAATRALQKEREEINAQRADSDRDLSVQREALAQREAELQARAAALDELRGKLEAGQQALAEESKEFVEARTKLDSERQATEEAVDRAKIEFETAKREALSLKQQLPELELRAGTALERLTHAREQMRDQLDEVNSYANQCRDELEGLRGQIQTEAERVHRQEQNLRRQQDEQRLAVAAFRQQLIDWQGQIADMKSLMAHDETRLEQRHAEVVEQARQLGADTARLAMQADDLEAKARAVAGKRADMDRHLGEMREWYRRKLRELAGIPSQDTDGPAAPVNENEPETEDAGRDILSLTGDVDPIDRKLGDLMTGLELIDDETLTALLVEARRQRRSLRQVLLASGAVTLYQMALIEAGNLDGLVIGHVRIIDRLRSTPRETVFRVFDPRRGSEAILRRLTDEEAQNAGHADEFKQQFGKAMATHANLAATLEVLDAGGRPAVLQEWLTGLPSGDWPALAAAPGAWYRLLLQAGQALNAAHEAGLVHGHLQAHHFVLTGDGILKLCGFGEPAWLVGGDFTREQTDDLMALGRIAGEWSLAAQRQGGRGRPLPEPLKKIVEKLADGRLTSAGVLLERLEQAAASVPVNPEAWDRLLRHVRDNAASIESLRASA
jgi:chromosome segregation ATPase